MGQARNRGTREQRIVQSIERERQKKEDAKRAANEWWESLTEEEQQEELRKHRRGKDAAMKMHTIMATLAGMEAGR